MYLGSLGLFSLRGQPHLLQPDELREQGATETRVILEMLL